VALIRRFLEKHMERNSLHDEIEASYTLFERDGRSILQIDTYGRENREMPGKKSQSIQIDEAGAIALRAILKEAFNV